MLFAVAIARLAERPVATVATTEPRLGADHTALDAVVSANAAALARIAAQRPAAKPTAPPADAAAAIAPTPRVDSFEPASSNLGSSFEAVADAPAAAEAPDVKHHRGGTPLKRALRSATARGKAFLALGRSVSIAVDSSSEQSPELRDPTSRNEAMRRDRDGWLAAEHKEIA